MYLELLHVVPHWLTLTTRRIISDFRICRDSRHPGVERCFILNFQVQIQDGSCIPTGRVAGDQAISDSIVVSKDNNWRTRHKLSPTNDSAQDCEKFQFENHRLPSRLVYIIHQIMLQDNWKEMRQLSRCISKHCTNTSFNTWRFRFKSCICEDKTKNACEMDFWTTIGPCDSRHARYNFKALIVSESNTDFVEEYACPMTMDNAFLASLPNSWPDANWSLPLSLRASTRWSRPPSRTDDISEAISVLRLEVFSISVKQPGSKPKLPPKKPHEVLHQSWKIAAFSKAANVAVRLQRPPYDPICYGSVVLSSYVKRSATHMGKKVFQTKELASNDMLQISQKSASTAIDNGVSCDGRCKSCTVAAQQQWQFSKSCSSDWCATLLPLPWYRSGLGKGTCWSAPHFHELPSWQHELLDLSHVGGPPTRSKHHPNREAP